MRNLKFKTKKIIAMFLVALTIYTSVFSSSVLQVEAVGIPYSGEFMSAMMQVYGYNVGFGTSVDGMNNTSSAMFAEMQARWNKGEIYEVDGTEVPDLRVASNFTNFVYESYDFLTLYNNGSVTNNYLTQLNEKSYKATGTLVTKTFLDALEETKTYIANTTSDVLTSELETVFSTLTNDDAEISNMNTLSMVFGSIIAGIAVKSQVDATNAWTNTLDTSIWNVTDLYKFYVDCNGHSVPVYYGTEFVFYEDDFKVVWETSVPSFFFVYETQKDVFGYLNFFANKSCSLKKSYFRLSNGEYVGANTYSLSSYSVSGVYGYAVNYSSCDFCDFEVFDASSINTEYENHRKVIAQNLVNIGFNYNYLDQANSMDASVTDALKSYSGRAVTKSKLLELSDMLEERAGTAAGTETAVSEIASTITEAAAALPEAGTGSGTGTGEYASILEQMLAILGTLSSDITGYFALPLSGIQEGIDAIPAAIADVLSGVDALPGELASLGDRILTIPKSLWEYLEKPLADILDSTKAIADVQKQPWEDDDTDRSSDSVSLLNGFYFLIIIIIKLLEIFWHCLQFIVAIFEIQASTAFLPEEVIMGLDYLKTLEITGIGLSVYDFLMGLVYILIVFSVVRVLRKNIDRIHVPGHGIKKAS